MSDREELRTLIESFERKEPMSDEDKKKMSVLAWKLGVNGLLNPEDNAWDGAKEAWFASAENANFPEPEVEYQRWD